MQLTQRANVSVEMALISMFVLFPVMGGGADFVELIAAKSQLNAAFPAFYSFAWNNPASATDTTQLAGILAVLNQHNTVPVTFADGRVDAGTTTPPTISYNCTPPTGPKQTGLTSPCPTTDAQEEYVTYSLSAKVNLPVQFPFGFMNPFQLQASGQIQVE
jgi:hypothetical protein